MGSAGELFDDRWIERKRLGQGGQGVAFLVEDTVREHAGLLVLKKQREQRPSPRIVHEIAALELIHHPRVLRLVAKNLNVTPPYFVTEFVSGGDLEARKLWWRALPVDQRLRKYCELLEAVAAVHHAGIVHRDVKPGNVFLNDDEQLILGDFGLAFLAEEERVTRVNEVVGPRGFIAPELMTRRLDEVTPACDVYSLGMLLHWMLSPDGLLPLYDEYRRPQDNLEVLHADHRYAGVNAFLDRCIRRDPAMRFQTAQGMLEHFPAVMETWASGIVIDDVLTDHYAILRFFWVDLKEMAGQLREWDVRKRPDKMRHALHRIVEPWETVKDQLRGIVDDPEIWAVSQCIDTVVEMGTMLSREKVREIGAELTDALERLERCLPPRSDEPEFLEALGAHAPVDRLIQLDTSTVALQSFYSDVRRARGA